MTDPIHHGWRVLIATVLCGIVLCFGILPGRAQSELVNTRNLALGMLRTYSRDAYLMITRYEKAPRTVYVDDTGLLSLQAFPGAWPIATGGGAEPFTHFINGDTVADLMRTLSTAVHESSHHYAARLGLATLARRKERVAEGTRALGYYIDQRDTQVAIIGPNFPARDIAKRIPIALHSEMYVTYVDSPTETQSTQQYGVYALLDEFVAYYHGTRVAYDLFPQFCSTYRRTPREILLYLRNVESTIGAYYELRYDILTYLLHAREHRPEVYESLMTNMAFTRTFVEIDDRFEKLLLDYTARKERTIEYLATLSENTSSSITIDNTSPWYQQIDTIGAARADQLDGLFIAEMKKDPYANMLATVRQHVPGH